MGQDIEKFELIEINFKGKQKRKKVEGSRLPSYERTCQMGR